MAEGSPFSLSLEEERELRQVSNLLFSGCDPSQFQETEELLIKWNPFFTIFLQSVDRRTGSLLHMPFNVGLFELPAKTMTILRVIQEEFLKTINKALKR